MIAVRDPWSSASISERDRSLMESPQGHHPDLTPPGRLNILSVSLPSSLGTACGALQRIGGRVRAAHIWFWQAPRASEE